MKRLHLFATILLSAVSLHAFSQSDFENNTGSQTAITSDQSLIRAIAPFDENVRNDILTAIRHPDVLEKLSAVRDRSSVGFQNIIRKYPQQKQEWFYEISRYPELMHRLAALPGKTSRDAVEGMLPNPSPQLKEAAWKLYRRHHDQLVAVDDLNQQAVHAFEQMIAPLEPDARQAFKTLEEMPDVLSILNDHQDLTSRLSDRYTADASAVRQDLADAHDQLATENQEQLADYQQELAQNPDAMKELGQASEAYAANGGYSYPAPQGEKVINYGNPYSYWFGYPGWYGSAMWYPGWYGYGSGFYLNGGYPMVYALPSAGFSRWFFGGAYRYYPHLYRQYGQYYHDRAVTRRVIAPSGSGFMGNAQRHFNGGNINRGFNYPADRSYRSANRSFSPSSARPMMRSNGFGAPAARSFSNRSFGGSGGVGRGGFSGGSFRGGRR